MFSSRFPAMAALAIVPALFVAFVVTGCSSHRPENNPYLAEKFAAIEEAIGSLERIEREVTLLRSDLDFFDQELADIKAMKGGLTPSEQEKMNDIAAKLDEFDRLASQLGNAKAVLTSAASSEPSPFGSSVASIPDGATETEVAVAPKKETTEKAPEAKPTNPTQAARQAFQNRQPTSSSSTSSKSSTTTASSSTSRSSGSGGAYHTVKAGESIQSIAKARGVSAVALAQKNKVPVNAMLPAGSRLWLPR